MEVSEKPLTKVSANSAFSFPISSIFGEFEPFDSLYSLIDGSQYARDGEKTGVTSFAANRGIFFGYHLAILLTFGGR